ncbi:hypothetical protein ACG98H_05315 [Corynebacterium sp. L4756]|uniref:6PGD fold domain-containing protein n=1 Tax=unclassified Corynebacterium TaxID=2624378 RepID=UPI00374DD562
MPAPRMNVGWLGRSNALRTLLTTQGHDVIDVDDIPDVSAFEAIVISTPQQQVEGLALALEPHIRRGQIVIHTSIGLGVQVLDPVEVKGALAMAIAHVGTDRWLVSTSDELAQGIAEVLLFESGQVSVPKTDSERAELAPKIVYAELIARITSKAYRDVYMDIGDDALFTDPDALLDNGLTTIEPSDVYAAFAGITDPGFRKAYVEAARRVGELENNMELEMWGLQEELR